MTFDATETSKLSQPVEYITLKNGATQWLYTNSNKRETLGAREFEPLAYTRTEPAYSKDTADGQIKLTVPNNIPLLEFYGTLPTSNVSTMQIERSHRNDGDGEVQIFWKGAVASVQREKKFATILGLPLTQLRAQIPRYTYSALCNWFLFQDRCGLTRENWRHQGTVTTIDTGDILITVDGLANQAIILQNAVDAAASPSGASSPNHLANYWTGGYCENSVGEKRSVYASTVDGNPDKIRIIQPFRSLAVSDSITVYAGCDRLRKTCKTKFLNVSNHGGFPDIPVVNPFTSEMPSGGASSDKKVVYKGFYE